MDFEGALRKVRQRPKIDGWATTLQVTCEEYWQALANGEQAAQDLVEEFGAMLHEDDSFDIARFAIPELRGFIDNPPCASQQRVLELTSGLSRALRDHNAITQDDFDSVAYREEKDILLDAEIHRASILIHNSGTLDPASAEEIRTWLEQRPGRKQNQEQL